MRTLRSPEDQTIRRAKTTRDTLSRLRVSPSIRSSNKRRFDFVSQLNVQTSGDIMQDVRILSAITAGSSMLAITRSLPPQRRQIVIPV